MNVTIEGYVSYICTGCKEKYNVDGKSLVFQEDTSLEAEDDEYIRYISQLDAPCALCAKDMLIKLEVWEHPESVVNYSYYSDQSVSAVECEFTIEHYFNDEIAIKEDDHYEPEIGTSTEDETDEKVFNESSKEEKGYVDQYDHEE